MSARAFCDDLMVLYAGSVVELASRSRFSDGVHQPYTRLLVDSVPDMDTTWLARRAATQALAQTDAASLSASATTGGLCPFLPRCPVAIAGTCTTTPPPRQQRDGQTILCHHDWMALMNIASQAETRSKP